MDKRGIQTTAVVQKVKQKYEDIACNAKLFLPYLRQASKIYVAASHSVVRQEKIEISQQRPGRLLYEVLHKKSTEV